jgi:hypothetical protein
MNQYDNTNKGAIFKNNQKAHENQPEYKGSLNVEGKEYWVSVWINEKKSDGEKYMSLKLTAKDEVMGGAVKPQPQQQPQAQADIDEVIPF